MAQWSYPSTEVWIKLGGDKGGGAFKMNFQIVNTKSPNSISSTCVFACFEAQDNITNFHIALDKYKEQVMNLAVSQWKYVYYSSCSLKYCFATL